jgi:hypothetical protein
MTFTTVDTVGHILAGTFEFMLTDTVDEFKGPYRITEGRFDMGY